jgi:hypothetical protein
MMSIPRQIKFKNMKFAKLGIKTATKEPMTHRGRQNERCLIFIKYLIPKEAAIFYRNSTFLQLYSYYTAIMFSDRWRAIMANTKKAWRLT